MNTDLTDTVARIVERAGREQGIEPVEVQFRGGGNQRLLRIFIDKPQGVTHSDCEMISHYVGTVLDAENLVPGGSYTLEVSSPGAERKLSRPRDFARFVGHKVKIVTREPVSERKLWEGTLSSFENDMLAVQPPSGDLVRIRLDQVDRANLKLDW